MVRARREFRDVLTGELRTGPGPGIQTTGKFVARVKPKKDKPAVVVEVPRDAVDEPRGSFPIRRASRAAIALEADQLATESVTKRRAKPRTAPATFPGGSAAKAADQFIRGNSEFVDVLGELGDPIDAVRDWMDPLRVYQGGRTAKHLKKLSETTAGRGILEAFEGHKVRAGIRAALVWLFGQSRRKRWAEVPWFDVERFGDALLEGCDDSAKEWGERGKCTGWIWWPPGSGRSSAVADLVELPHDLKVAAVEAADLERLRTAVDQLEQAFKASKCLTAEDRRLVRRRLAYLRKLEAEPGRIARAAVCGPDPESGSMLCGFAALEHEARRIREACEIGYSAAIEGEGDDEPDLGRSATQEERESVPNVKKRKRNPEAPRKWHTEPGAYLYLPGPGVDPAFAASWAGVPLTYLEDYESRGVVRVIVNSPKGSHTFRSEELAEAPRVFGLHGQRPETSLDRQRRERAARTQQAKAAQAAEVQTRLAIDLEPDARQRSLFNPTPRNPWGKLVDLLARVIELDIEHPDGTIQRHTWHAARSRPFLFWSESKRALVFVQGGERPHDLTDDRPTGPEARRFKAWAGRSARGEAKISIPSGPIEMVGRAVRIVYSSARYRDGVPRHHDLGPGVRVRAGSPGPRRLWVISGGRLTATSRGLVG